MTRFVCVVGTRPEAIKLAPVVLALRNAWGPESCQLYVTGQHRDLVLPILSEFELKANEVGIVPTTVSSQSALLHEIAEPLGKYLSQGEGNVVIAQGDTTSVLAAALAAFWAKKPFAHVEAGLRTHDKSRPFPEEIYRRLVTQLTDIHFAPTERAANDLAREGVPAASIHVVGNTVVDAAKWMLKRMPTGYDKNAGSVLITTHRRENIGEPMRRVLSAVRELAELFPNRQFIVTVHPNPQVSSAIASELKASNVLLIPPAEYREFLRLMSDCDLMLSDSGGVQEEAATLRKPLLILRDVTERPEAVDSGFAKLVGTDQERIVREAKRLLQDDALRSEMTQGDNPFGDGMASERIAQILGGSFPLSAS